MLLHDRHTRQECFSERANSVFSVIEASKREMVSVREDIESARERELDTIAQLSMFLFFRAYSICLLLCANLTNTYIYMRQLTDVNEVIMMQASLTVITERLHSLEEKINSKFDTLTAVECSPMLSTEKEDIEPDSSTCSFFKLKTS
jgi:hypothetical protein